MLFTRAHGTSALVCTARNGMTRIHVQRAITFCEGCRGGKRQLDAELGIARAMREQREGQAGGSAMCVSPASPASRRPSPAISLPNNYCIGMAWTGLIVE